jgi:hypothetical protein
VTQDLNPLYVIEDGLDLLHEDDLDLLHEDGLDLLHEDGLDLLHDVIVKDILIVQDLTLHVIQDTLLVHSPLLVTVPDLLHTPDHDNELKIKRS